MKTRSLLYTLVLSSSLVQADENAATYARFVPERQDDFAFENDLIAFRAYGPASRSGDENSGFDAWLKRVPYPIIDKWYKQNAENQSYHKDHGEGLDNYKVGASAGCGGTGLWLNGKREPLETFTKYEILEVTPQRSQFKLTYQHNIDGTLYGEEKLITIELGKRLFQVKSSFTKNGKPAAGLPVCIGLTLQNGQAQPISNIEAGWIATWGTHGESELGTAVTMDAQSLQEIIITESKNKSDSHILLITKTNAKGEIHYKAGYGWKKAGAIKTIDDWKDYLNKVSK